MRLQCGMPVPFVMPWPWSAFSCQLHVLSWSSVATIIQTSVFWRLSAGLHWPGVAVALNCYCCGICFMAAVLPYSMSRFLQLSLLVLPYPLRNSLSISLPTCHSSRYSKSFLVSAISLYNSLPQSVSSCSSKHSFAQALNHHFASDKFSFGISWVFEFFSVFFFVLSLSPPLSLSLSLFLDLFSSYFFVPSLQGKPEH